MYWCPSNRSGRIASRKYITKYQVNDLGFSQVKKVLLAEWGGRRRGSGKEPGEGGERTVGNIIRLITNKGTGSASRRGQPEGRSKVKGG